MKKEKKGKSEKIYLKKGYYPLNDIYYHIFLSGNGKHYFSFVNNQGRTVLLNGNIKGFDSLEEAEKIIEEVLYYAKQKNQFEIKTAKDGKFFFNLYNDKGEKIAKSFFFRKKVDIEKSLNEFLNGKASSEYKKEKTQLKSENITTNHADIIPISPTTINEAARIKKEAEDAIKIKNVEELAIKKREEERRNYQLEKERKAKEQEILLAAKSAKRKEEKRIKELEKAEAIKLNAEKNPMKEKDAFDGCFRWLWILLVLLLLAVLFSYFKGCFGGLGDFVGNNQRDRNSIVDSLANDKLTDQDTKQIGQAENNHLSEEGDQNVTDSEDGFGQETLKQDNKNNIGVQSNGYENNVQSMADCNCSARAVVFDIPNSEAKKLNQLGTNPQFGNTHGLSAADFLEELKYRYQNDSWDRRYLNYLYNAMGYAGFQDARASQFSQEKLKAGSKGILGFGSYSGYAYTELELTGEDLEVFRIEAANGCHINFMKTCGNLFFMCQ